MLPVVAPRYWNAPPASWVPKIPSVVKVTPLALFIASPAAVSGTTWIRPPAMLTPPAKPAEADKACEPAAAFVARAAAPVILATVKVVALLIAETYQPAPAAMPGPVTGCPGTRFAVDVTVRTLAALEATFSAPVRPDTKPTLTAVPVLPSPVVAAA